MAQVERVQENKKASSRERAAERRQVHRRVSGDYQLSIRHHAALMALISAFAKKGGAVRVGLTRDGGALALGMYLEDDYATEYIRPTEDIVEAVTEICDAWFKDGGDAFQAEVVNLGIGEWLMGPTR